MGRVLTNGVGLSTAEEESLGELPAQPEWHILEPNSYSTFGATITNVVREPISKDRQRRKGTVTDLDSAVEFDCDLTMDHFLKFVNGFLFRTMPALPAVLRVVTAGAGVYNVASGGVLPDDSLIYAHGFAIDANNGFKLVTASTSTTVSAAGVVAETPPKGASISVCGVRGAADDIEIDASGDLTSTLLDFTTLGLTVGQAIYFRGGDVSINAFAQDDNEGYVRLALIETNKLTLDKRPNDFVTDTGAGKEIDLFFGRFLTNVDVDHADYLEQSYQFESTLPGLDETLADMYEYAKGNFCNSMGFALPLTNKATLTLGFIGTDTGVPTTTRATNAETPVEPLQTTAYNSSADIARIRIQEVDETGLTTDFKALTLTIGNSVTPEKVLGQLGARYMNAGTFMVDIESQLIFTNAAVASAVRENRTLSMDFGIKNDDGAIHLDIPSLTLGGGDKEYPVNASVLLNAKGEAFGDDDLGYSLGVSLFPYIS